MADLDVDVDMPELCRRLEEGLHDLAVLADLTGRKPRDRFCDVVGLEVDPATACAVVFAAALVAAVATAA